MSSLRTSFFTVLLFACETIGFHPFTIDRRVDLRKSVHRERRRRGAQNGQGLSVASGQYQEIPYTDVDQTYPLLSDLTHRSSAGNGIACDSSDARLSH